MMPACRGCNAPEGEDLTEVYQQRPCPRCGQPARSWWIERAEGSVHVYAGLACSACGHETGSRPDDA